VLGDYPTHERLVMPCEFRCTVRCRSDVGVQASFGFYPRRKSVPVPSVSKSRHLQHDIFRKMGNLSLPTVPDTQCVLPRRRISNRSWGGRPLSFVFSLNSPGPLLWSTLGGVTIQRQCLKVTIPKQPV
jgi:hypothetical protein